MGKNMKDQKCRYGFYRTIDLAMVYSGTYEADLTSVSATNSNKILFLSFLQVLPGKLCFSFKKYAKPYSAV